MTRADVASPLGVLIGTRPNIPKVYSLIKALRASDVPFVLMHTNQHHDFGMQQAFFDQLGFAPDLIMGDYSIGAAIDWAIRQITERGIRLLFVQGDSAPALVGSIAAVYTDIGLAHVEAGLRANDGQMIEERNRMMVDDVAHYLFCYTDKQARALRTVPFLRGHIHSVGNPTIDAIRDFQGIWDRPFDIPFPDYAFVTLHRKELTDSKERMVVVLAALRRCTEDFGLRIVLPMHPRTLQRASLYGINLEETLGPGVSMLEPVGFFDSLRYQRNARLVITDSGCIQEEACLLGVPCVTIRDNTERAETLEVGANVLAGYTDHRIHEAVEKAMSSETRWSHPYGAPGAGQRALDIVLGTFVDFRTYGRTP